MKKEKVEEEVEEITSEQLKEIKKEIDKSKNKSLVKRIDKYNIIFRNIVIAIFAVIFIWIIALGGVSLSPIKFLTNLKSIVIIEIIATIVILEIAFRKKYSFLMVHGIEMMLLACYTLGLYHLYANDSDKTRMVLLGGVLAIVVYYLIKSLIIRFKRIDEYYKYDKETRN